MKRQRDQVVAAAKKFTHSQLLLDTKLRPGDPYFEIKELREPDKRAAVPREDGRPRADGEEFDQFDKGWMDEHERRKMAMYNNKHYQFLLSLSGALSNSNIERLYNAESLESRMRRESLEELQRQFNEKRYDSTLADLRARAAELRLNRAEPVRLTLDRELAKRRQLRKHLAERERALVLSGSRSGALTIARDFFVEWAKALLAAVPSAAGNFAEARKAEDVASDIYGEKARREDEAYERSSTDSDRSAFRKALEIVFGWIAVENSYASGIARSLRLYDPERLEEIAEIVDALLSDKAQRGGGRASLQLRYAVLVDEGSEGDVELGELEEEDAEDDEEEERSEEERQPPPDEDEPPPRSEIDRAIVRLRAEGHAAYSRMELFSLVKFCADYASELKNPDVKGAPDLALTRAENYARADAELRTEPFRPVRPIDFADLVRVSGKVDAKELFAALRRRDVVVLSLGQLRETKLALSHAKASYEKRMQDASADEFYDGAALYRNLSGGLGPDLEPIGLANELERADAAANAAAREVAELRVQSEAAAAEYKALEEQWERANSEKEQLESEIADIEAVRRSALAEIERLTKGYHNRFQWMAMPENSGLVDLDQKVIFGLQRACEKVKAIMPDADRHYTKKDGDRVLLEALMTSDATKTRFAHLTAIVMLYTSTLWNKQWSDPRTLPVQAEDEAAISNFFERQVYWSGRELKAAPSRRFAIPKAQPRRHPIGSSLPAW